MAKFSKKELQQMKETYEKANNPTVLRLIEHIEQVEKELESALEKVRRFLNGDC